MVMAMYGTAIHKITFRPSSSRAGLCWVRSAAHDGLLRYGLGQSGHLLSVVCCLLRVGWWLLALPASRVPGRRPALRATAVTVSASAARATAASAARPSE